MSHPIIRFLDRAKETTSTTGTGTITLGGAVAGFVAIGGIGDGNSTYYTITEGNEFEVGIGTYTSSGNTLSRDQVFASSNAGNKITLAGSATIFITYPADKTVAKTSGNYVGIGIDPEYQLQVSGTGSFNTVRWADGSIQTTAATGTTSYTAGTGLNLVGTTFNASGSTTSNQGIVQLQDSLSTSTTTAITPNAVNTASGNLQSSIDTNTTNIATNVTNIAATGATNAAAIATNVTNIATNVTNIAATGATNAAAIATNATDIATNATSIAATGATNAAAIATNTTNIATNATDIATNTTNIAATGATNAAAIATNVTNIATNATNIAATGATNAAAIATNVTNIATNATNIAATGATNAAAIATNATNISTNTTNIAATGATNAAAIAVNATDIDTVSGLLGPSGSNTEVQFNDNGVFGGDSDFTWNKTTNTLTVAGYSLPTSDASLSGYVLTSNSDGTTKWAPASGTAGSGGGAPLDAQYVTLALAGGLSDERVLVVGTGLQLTDGGANSNVTVDASGATTSNIGVVQLQDSATDGTVDKAITPNAVYDVSGVLQTNIASTGATNAAAIATNATDIATNTTNIAATGATNAAAIATNATDIATNATNIAATGATNAAAIATNVTNIATNATNIAATGATNASAIATNVTNIATNATNIAATGATNAAAIVTNTTNIAATGATNAAAIATNTTNISTNTTNIAATGATNAAAIVTNTTNIAATGATNAAAIATNTTNISTNTTNIAATGATNAADIVTVSGIAVSKDNYQYWTSTDGSNNANIETTDTVKYTGAGTVTVSLASGSPSVVTISGSGGGGTPDGSDTYVQFNDGGSAFGGESNFTFTKAGSGILKVGTIVTNDADAGRIGAVSIGSGAYVMGDNAIAIGAGTYGGGAKTRATSRGVAIGVNSIVSDTNGIAIGQTNTASDQYAIAIGAEVTASAHESIGIGRSITSDGFGGIAIGGQSRGRYGGVSIGYKSASQGSRSIAIGEEAGYAGPTNDGNNVSIGYQANAPTSGLVIGAGAHNSILSGLFNSSAASTNGYLLTSTKFGINRTSAPDAMLDVTNQAATDVGAIIQGAASQTADLTQWQNSAGTTLASMGMTTSNDRATLMVSGTIVANVADASRIGVVSIGSGAYTTNYSTVAIGDRAAAKNTMAIAIGRLASSEGVSSIAIGDQATAASASHSTIAIGESATASANRAVAIGKSSTAGQESLAVGTDSDANGLYTTAIGFNADAGATAAVAVGNASIAAERSVALGMMANAGTYGVAIGQQTVAPTSGLIIGAAADNSILSGQFNSSTSHTDGFLNVLANKLQVSGDGSVKVNNQYTFPTGVTPTNDYVLTAQTDGTTAWASGGGGGGATSPATPLSGVQFNDNGSFGAESNFTFSKAGSGILKVGTIVTNDADAGRVGVVSIGSGASVDAGYSVAIGDRAKVEGGGGGAGVAVGSRSDAYTNSVAIGCEATANTHFSTAVGFQSDANASAATAMGYQAHAGTSSVAVGHGADASYSYGVAIGNAAKMKDIHGVAIGYQAEAYDSAVAVGLLAKTLGTNAIAIGGRVVAPTSGLVIGAAADNSILSGLFNSSAASTNGYLLTSTKFGINRTSAPDAMLDVTNQAATDVGTIIQGAASQTADLTQWQNSAGTTVASVGMTTANDATALLLSNGSVVSNTGDYARSLAGGMYYGGNLISIGSGSRASADNTIAIGTDTYAEGPYSVALGWRAETKAAASYGVSIGFDSDAQADRSIAIGHNAMASQTTVAIGFGAGHTSYTNSTRSVFINNARSLADHAYSCIAIGYDSRAGGPYSVSLGHKTNYSNSAHDGYDICIGDYAEADAYAIALGHKANAPTSGLVVGAGVGNSILSGQFNSSTSHTDGFLNILANKLQVSGDGSVKVNNQYTFPTGDASSSGHVLTSYADGTTVWAATTGGSSSSGPDGSDTYVQFNDGGSAFGGESNFTFTKAGSGILKVGTIIADAADAASYPENVAVGSGARASYTKSVAVGGITTATYTLSTAVGYNADAASYGSVAIGSNSVANGEAGTAVGHGAYATATRAVALGYLATSNGQRSITIGDSSNDNSNTYTVCIGYAARSHGTRSVAVGRSAQASAYSVALGHQASAPTSGLVIGAAADNSILSGSFNTSAASTNGYLLTSTKFGINRTSTPDAMLDVTNQAATDVGAIIQGAASQTADLTQWQNSAGTTLASMGLNTANDAATMILSGTIVTNTGDLSYTNPVSIGSGAYVGGNWSIAMGNNAKANALQSIAIGRLAEATAQYGVAVGGSASAADLSTALGQGAKAESDEGTAVGHGAVAGAHAVAVGYTAGANQHCATSVGHNSQSYGQYSAAVGCASAAGDRSVAMGLHAHADPTMSIAIGNYQYPTESGLCIGMTSSTTAAGRYSMFSGLFNSSKTATNGFLNIFENKLQVSGDGSVKVNNQYTFPTGDASVSGYVLTSYADGTTVWASGGGGGATSPDTPYSGVQFNDGGSFGAESNFTFSKAGSGILKVGTIVTNDADAAHIGVVSIGSGAYAVDDPSVGADGAVAIGRGAKAPSNSVAIGRDADGGSRETVAIGYSTYAYGQHSTAIGYDCQTNGSYAAAIGHTAVAESRAYAIGKSITSQRHGIGIGNFVNVPESGFVIGNCESTPNAILSGLFNSSAASTNGYLLTSTKFGINRTSTPDAMLDVTNFAATDVGAIIQGAASQTADLTQWQNSAGTTLASMGMTTSNDRATLMVSGTIVSNVADASRIGAVSIGSGAYVTSDYSVAIGARAQSLGTGGQSIAIGQNAQAQGFAIAIGGESKATTHVNSVAIGYMADANNEHAVAIGKSSRAENAGVSIGLGAYGENYCVVIGQGASSTVTASVAIGLDAATLGGTEAVALGVGAQARERATAVGPRTVAGTHGVALGNKAVAPTSGLAVAAGVGNSILSGQFNSSTSHTDGFLNVLANKLQVSGDGSVKVNNQYTFPTGDASSSGHVLTSYADGTTVWAATTGGSSSSGPDGSDTYVQFNDGGSAFGGESNFTFTKAGSGILKVGTIVTNDADAGREGVVSIGSGAYSTQDDCVVIGRQSWSKSNGSTVIGRASEADNATRAVAIGYWAVAKGNNAVVIGYYSHAHQDTVSIGYGANQGNSSATRSTFINSAAPHDSSANGSVAIGYRARSRGPKSVSIGHEVNYNISAHDGYDVAIGNYTKSEAYGIAFGYQASAPTSGLVIGAAADNSILSGLFNSSAASTNGYLLTSTKFGINRTSAPDAMLDVTNQAATDVGAIIQGAASQTADLTQWQNSAGTTLASMGMTTSNDRATLMVSGTIVSNVADASRIGVVSIGSGAYNTQNGGVAIGHTAINQSAHGVAIGYGTSTYSTSDWTYAGIAIGNGANTTNIRSIAMGYNTTADAESVAIGGIASVVGKSVGLGWDADAAASYAVSVGYKTNANGYGSIAIGGEDANGTSALGVGAIALGFAASASDDYSLAIGHSANAPISGLVVTAGVGNSILSGQFNSSTSHTDGFLNVLANKLQVSGDGSVKVNNQYTFPTGVTPTNDYVLTAQTDGSTAWASAGGGSPGGSDTQIQFNAGGTTFAGDNALVWNSGTNVLTISGHLAATTKSFLIDHPTIPEKKLQYACLEGPENGVYVRGHTNDNIIDLPDYWSSLVDEESITVQITAKDAPQPYLYVSGVLNNKVYLISDRSVSAYYTINGTRKDVAPLQVEI